MKKLGKILLWSLITLVVLLVIGISLTIGWRPFIGSKARPLTARQFERTPQRLERGRYLFTSSTGCTGCHSLHDWNTHGGPVIPAGEGVGQVMWMTNLPGRIVASNITSDPETGAGSWTDDQLARAIREGIGHDGRALFPIMPYQNLKHMSDEDLASLIVYIRSLRPVRNPLPKTEIIFPVKYLIRNVPEPVTGPVSSPDRSVLVAENQIGGRSPGRFAAIARSGLRAAEGSVARPDQPARPLTMTAPAAASRSGGTPT